MYSGTRSWSELLEAGGVPTLPGGPSEAALRRGLGRLLPTDDALRIDQYRAFALAPVAPVIAELAVNTRRLSHMLATVVTEKVLIGYDTLDKDHARLSATTKTTRKRS